MGFVYTDAPECFFIERRRFLDDVSPESKIEKLAGGYAAMAFGHGHDEPMGLHPADHGGHIFRFADTWQRVRPGGLFREIAEGFDTEFRTVEELYGDLENQRIGPDEQHSLGSDPHHGAAEQRAPGGEYDKSRYCPADHNRLG